MADNHGRTVAAAASAELTALGFRQKGRSRLWLADHGSWLNVVEFTPSSWSKSVSLMNAAHWMWHGAGFMSFDVAIPLNCHAKFETEDQFRSAATEIAKNGRTAALAMTARFASFAQIADFVVARARSSPDRMVQSWWGYEAGIASALEGRPEEASRFLLGIADDRVIARAAQMVPLVADPDAFKAKVNDMVTQERARLELRPLRSPLF